MKLFHTDCPDFKKKIDKNNLYVTCTQNLEVPVFYQWCCTEMQERAQENSVKSFVIEHAVDLITILLFRRELSQTVLLTLFSQALSRVSVWHHW